VKRTLLIALLGVLVLLAAAPAFAQNDKLQHFGLGYLSGSVGMALSPESAASRRTSGVLTALAVGVAKEATDPRFSAGDITADLLGGLAAVTLTGSLGSPSGRTLSFTGIQADHRTIYAAVYTIRF
jgi:hypothetical protein